MERLRKAGLTFEHAIKEKKTAGPLAGKVFVLTGTLPNLTREDAKARIEAAGGKVTGIGEQERPTTWWRARMPVRSWTRPARWESR